MTSMTNNQRRLIELDKKYVEVKKFYDELREAVTAVAEDIGIDGFFQDPESGTVFQITKPDGRFVHYEPVSYLRTRKEGETRGSLSVKKAEEAGFEI